MKAVIFFAACLSIASLAMADTNPPNTFINVSDSSLTVWAMDMTDTGVPRVVSFRANGKEITVGMATTKDGNPVDDLSLNQAENQVLLLAGQQTEGDVCSLNAQLSVVDANTVKIYFDQATVGTAFFAACPDQAKFEGLYKK